MSATTFTAPAEPASVPLLRHQVVGFLRDGRRCDDREQDIRLAVSEALSNVVLHAYRDGEPVGDVTVTAERRDGAVEVVVRDRGRGMAPRADSPGAGLGLPVMRHTSDEITFAPADGGRGTEVHLHFSC